MAKYSEVEKKRHLDDWDRSGLSAKAYAAHGGMNYKTLLSWQAVRRESALIVRTSAKAGTTPARFVEVVVDRRGEVGSTVERPSAIEIVTGRGATVLVRDTFTEQTLRRVLDVFGCR